MDGLPAPRLDEGMFHNRIELLREITLSLLSELESLGRSTAPDPDASLTLDEEVKRFEIALIRAALDQAHNNQARAARMLGVKPTTLNAKIKRYQLQISGCAGHAEFPNGKHEIADYGSERLP
jgi:transcriptional regulator with GAF, ATPase, and Fis domain